MQQKLTVLYRAILGFSIVGLTGAFGLSLRLVSLGRLTDFNRRYLVAFSSRLVLQLMGIKLVAPPHSAFPKDPVLYTFNHNSYLDTLILTALGLGNTRCLLSEKTLKILPLTLSALSIGTMYIPLKKAPERRLKFFRKLHRQSVKGRFSVIGSSEGTHAFIHGIAPFNKGVYHFAAVSNLDVVPLYFHIPRESNPIDGIWFKKGTVTVEILGRFSTAGWQLHKLPKHVAEMRELFINKFNEAHQIKV